ncbi:hypothetical protein [Chitinophaga solisilvae]|uniref:hypothetical protein n=1 Tax=Chitinophaga solisilvae TaxID=1233460 RepID=UPI00136E34BF|nr:hypothetical protein [Chitinophaga solisilvae]
MSKQLLLLAALYLVSTGYAPAQNVITAGRITVRDSLFLGNRWIKAVNNENDMRYASPQTISTDGALKNYLRTEISNAADKPDRISLLHTFRRYTANPYLQGTIHLTVTSEDSIVTPITLRMQEANLFKPKGRPPFSVAGSYVNNTPGTVVDILIKDDLGQLSQLQPANFTQRFARYKDTIQLDTYLLYGGFRIEASMRDEPPVPASDTLVTLSIDIINATEHDLVQTVDNILPPRYGVVYKKQMVLHRSEPLPFAMSRVPVAVLPDGRFVYMGNNDRIMYQVFKNGEEFKFQSGSDWLYIDLDPTWKELKIIAVYEPND